MKPNCFGIPDTYRGRIISQGPDDLFYACRPGDWRENAVASAETWDELRDCLDAQTPEQSA